MRQFFYPSSIVVFGVSENPRNLARNIIVNCRDFGFDGDIHAVGQTAGRVNGCRIMTDANALPRGIDLAILLVPAETVARTLDICGRRGIRHAVVSTGGFREFDHQGNQVEKDLVETARRHGIRFIGPNCIGVICANSGLCTPFNPMNPKSFKKGTVSVIAQSGGVATQAAFYFSEEHVGFSKIISAGNKLNLGETELIDYLIQDPDTRQIHLYLESIDDGRQLIALARKSNKPIVLFKSNVSRAAAGVAQSHTAALSNDDRIVSDAIKQAGIIRAENIHDMTVCAKALRLPPLRGNRLAAISLSGGFAVILGDACERCGFTCPPLPRSLIEEIESHRRGGVIRMANPMDFGDVHDLDVLVSTIRRCLALAEIDGLVLSFMYGAEMARMFGQNVDGPEPVLRFVKKMSDRAGKPIALSFFAERKYIEQLKAVDVFPVFNDPEESVRALQILRAYSRQQSV